MLQTHPQADTRGQCSMAAQSTLDTSVRQEGDTVPGLTRSQSSASRWACSTSATLRQQLPLILSDGGSLTNGGPCDSKSLLQHAASPATEAWISASRATPRANERRAQVGEASGLSSSQRGSILP